MRGGGRGGSGAFLSGERGAKGKPTAWVGSLVRGENLCLVLLCVLTSHALREGPTGDLGVSRAGRALPGLRGSPALRREGCSGGRDAPEGCGHPRAPAPGGGGGTRAQSRQGHGPAAVLRGHGSSRQHRPLQPTLLTSPAGRTASPGPGFPRPLRELRAFRDAGTVLPGRRRPRVGAGRAAAGALLSFPAENRARHASAGLEGRGGCGGSAASSASAGAALSV